MELENVWANPGTYIDASSLAAPAGSAATGTAGASSAMAPFLSVLGPVGVALALGSAFGAFGNKLPDKYVKSGGSIDAGFEAAAAANDKFAQDRMAYKNERSEWQNRTGVPAPYSNFPRTPDQEKAWQEYKVANNDKFNASIQRGDPNTSDNYNRLEAERNQQRELTQQPTTSQTTSTPQGGDSTMDATSLMNLFSQIPQLQSMMSQYAPGYSAQNPPTLGTDGTNTPAVGQTVDDPSTQGTQQGTQGGGTQPGTQSGVNQGQIQNFIQGLMSMFGQGTAQASEIPGNTQPMPGGGMGAGYSPQSFFQQLFNPTNNANPSNTNSFSPVNTPTNTASPTNTNQFTATNTPTNTLTNQPTNTFNPANTNTLSNSNAPVNSFTPTNTSALNNTSTVSPTISPSNTFNPSNVGTVSPTISPTNTNALSQMFSPAYSPSNTQAFSPTNTASNTQAFNPTFNPAYSPTSMQSFNPAYSPTSTQQFNPTVSPSQSQTQTFNPNITVNPATVPNSYQFNNGVPPLQGSQGNQGGFWNNMNPQNPDPNAGVSNNTGNTPPGATPTSTSSSSGSDMFSQLMQMFGIQNPAQAGLGAGILGIGGLMNKDVKLPDFWSDRGVQDLANWGNSANHPMDPNVDAAIQRSMDIQNEQQLRNLRDVYKNLRPGTDYTTDTNYQRDLGNLNRSMALNSADAKAGSQLASNAQNIGIKSNLAEGSVGQGRIQGLFDTQKQTNQNKLFGDLGSSFINSSLQKPPQTYNQNINIPKAA